MNDEKQVEMKTILIILDGASEEKIQELGNKTPLEYARTPVLVEITRCGHHTNSKFYPAGRTPDSLNCTLSILGVNASLIPVNRAYLEAVAAGINIGDTEVAFRCNLVSIKNGKLHSFNGMGLSSEEMKFLSQNIKSIDGVKFHHVSGYRNILAVEKNKLNGLLKNMPPHENVGAQFNELSDNLKNVDLLYEFAVKNKLTYEDADYMFYPWGISEKVELPSFQELHNKTCSCICHAEIIKGIAKSMDIDVPVLKNSTGDVDTDLREKAAVVLQELKSHDVVIAHINGTDEASHRRDLYGKIKFIEKVDREFLSPIYASVNNQVKIIVLADHQTSSISGKHEKGSVDVIINQMHQYNNFISLTM